MSKRQAIIILILLSFTTGVFSDEFSFDDHGFSITLPNAWTVIPADTMEQLYPNMLTGWWVVGQTGVEAQILVSLLRSGPLPIPDEALLKSMASQFATGFSNVEYHFDDDAATIWISGTQKTGSITIQAIMAAKLTSFGILLLVLNTTTSAERVRRAEFVSVVANLKLSPEVVWHDPTTAPLEHRTGRNSIIDELARYTQNKSYEFTTRGHEKSLGVSLRVSVPEGWEMEEGQRPHIVQRFTSKSYDSKLAMCVINIDRVPAIVSILSDEDIAEVMFSDEAVSESLPQGSQIVSAKSTKYDGQPGLFIVYTYSAQRAGFDVKGYTAEHRFIYHKRYVSVSCSYSGTDESFDVPGIEKELQAFQLLSQMIANSIVIDKW